MASRRTERSNAPSRSETGGRRTKAKKSTDTKAPQRLKGTRPKEDKPPAEDCNSEFKWTRVYYRYSKAGYVYYLAPTSTLLSGVEHNAMFVVAPSALLTPPNQDPTQLGLFAARPLPPGEPIGNYSGEVVASKNAAHAIESFASKLPPDKNKLLVHRVADGSYQLLDGDRADPPYISLINDPSHTSSSMEKSLVANVVNEGLFFRVDPDRRNAIPAFDLEKPLSDNKQSELRWNYSMDLTPEIRAIRLSRDEVRKSPS